MPLIIFWLTPVFLVVIFLIVLTQHKVSIKPKLFIIEPLLYLIKKWQLARIEGDEKNTRRLFSYWLPGLEMQRSIVEQLVRQVDFNRPVIPDESIAILNQRTLPFWAEERELELRAKKSSVLAGPISEVIEYCDADTRGKLTREDIDSWRKKADKAYANGFWALALAESSSAQALESKKYKLIGLMILEPVINKKAEAVLRRMTAVGQVKFLSFLPASFIERLVQKIFPSRKVQTINGQELSKLSPIKQEAAMDSKEIFGEMAAKNRYYIVRHYRSRYSLTVASLVPSDDELPADNRI